MISNNFIRSVEFEREKVADLQEYPFSIPVIKNFSKMDFTHPVTFIVWENGSGKSTILEAIATAYGFSAEWWTKNIHFSTKDSHSDLGKFLKIIKWISVPENHFFLRAESYYNFATFLEKIEYWQLNPFASYGGKSLHENSHGESFFATIIHRFGKNGIYILDEPESALSPTKQLAFLLRMQELIQEKSQFIIATHSPILLAFPHTTIYEIINGKIMKTHYKDTEHFRLYKDFIENPEYFLKHLWL